MEDESIDSENDELSWQCTC